MQTGRVNNHLNRITIWIHAKIAPSLETFQSKLKTYLFKLSYDFLNSSTAPFSSVSAGLWCYTNRLIIVIIVLAAVVMFAIFFISMP